MGTPNFEEIAIKHGIMNGLSIYSNSDIIKEKFDEYTKDVYNLAIQNVADHTHECGLTNPIIGKPAILKLKQ